MDTGWTDAPGPLSPVAVDSVSARDGFAWWHRMVERAVVPLTISIAHVDRFRGTATSVQAARTEVSAFSFSPMSWQRTPAHIRQADSESYFLLLVHGSPVRLEQGRTSTTLRAGELTLFDTSHPLACEFEDHGRQSRVTLIRLPRADLPLPQGRADGFLATRLPARTGSGALLTNYLAGLRANAAQCDATELHRLGAVGFDLATAFLAARLDSTAALPAEARAQVLLARIDAFIDHNLADTGLSPAVVAAHHHISVRSLHGLFQQQAETVGARIRRLRLEHSRADLADLRLRHRTVGETAARWGFRHPADFSRAFRAAYGVPPSEFRRQAPGELRG